MRLLKKGEDKIPATGGHRNGSETKRRRTNNVAGWVSMPFCIPNYVLPGFPFGYTLRICVGPFNVAIPL